MKLTVKLIALYLVFPILVQGQNYRDSISIQLQQIAEQGTLPGFAVSLFTNKKVLYQAGFGYADLAKKTPYTPQSTHNIGSSTKTLIAFALMKLVEEEKLQLDDSINQYLPFEIHHPDFPDQAITLRQLATHTSSLCDGADDMLIENSYLFRGAIDFSEEELPEGYHPYFEIYRENEPTTMARFLRDTYCKDGRWYDESNFRPEAPGTVYWYSNMGATLLAYIIEEVSGHKFADYTKKILLDPLKMSDSHWRLDDIPQDKLASLYLSNQLPIPHYELITYPDGGLFTNVADFSLYLVEMLKGINGESQLLKQSSYKEMMRNQLIPEFFPDATFERSRGMMWRVNSDEDNIAADGADPGVGTYVLMTTAGNMGIAIFKNISSDGEEEVEKALLQVRRVLLTHAGNLLKQASKE
ncbi:MAG: serine hydrolase domain-containing protein [Bacteroidota bacterium]